MAVGEVATRDFLRSELRNLVTDLEELASGGPEEESPDPEDGTEIVEPRSTT